MEEVFYPLEACMLFSEAQYDRREEWNHSHLAIEFVPVALILIKRLIGLRRGR
jgi:hypothetical protein